MSELTSTRIRTTAAKLGLPHLAEALNQYVQRADEAKMGYLDFLDLVLAEELAVRDDRRSGRGVQPEARQRAEVSGEGAEQRGQLRTDVARPRPPRPVQHAFSRCRRLEPEQRASGSYRRMDATGQMAGTGGGAGVGHENQPFRGLGRRLCSARP